MTHGLGVRAGALQVTELLGSRERGRRGGGAALWVRGAPGAVRLGSQLWDCDQGPGSLRLCPSLPFALQPCEAVSPLPSLLVSAARDPGGRSGSASVVSSAAGVTGAQRAC